MLIAPAPKATIKMQNVEQYPDRASLELRCAHLGQRLSAIQEYINDNTMTYHYAFEAYLEALERAVKEFTLDLNKLPGGVELEFEQRTAMDYDLIGVLLRFSQTICDVFLRIHDNFNHSRFLEGLTSNSSLKNFALKCCYASRVTLKVDSLHWMMLFNSLKSNKSIEKVSLQYVPILSRDVKHISTFAFFTPTLTSLSFNVMAISVKACNALLVELLGLEHLKQLNMSGNYRNHYLEPKTLNAIKANTSLKHLTLPTCLEVKKEPFMDLVSALDKNYTLLEFFMSNALGTYCLTPDSEKFVTDIKDQYSLLPSIERNQKQIISLIAKRFSEQSLGIEDIGQHELYKHLTLRDSLNLAQVNYEMYHGVARQNQTMHQQTKDFRPAKRFKKHR